MKFKPGDLIQLIPESYFLTEEESLFVWQKNDNKILGVKILDGTNFYGVYIKLHEFDNEMRDDVNDWHDILVEGQLYLVSTKQIMLVNEQDLYDE